jgi:hypothetical protein
MLVVVLAGVGVAAGAAFMATRTTKTLAPVNPEPPPTPAPPKPPDLAGIASDVIKLGSGAAALLGGGATAIGAGGAVAATTSTAAGVSTLAAGGGTSSAAGTGGLLAAIGPAIPIVAPIAAVAVLAGGVAYFSEQERKRIEAENVVKIAASIEAHGGHAMIAAAERANAENGGAIASKANLILEGKFQRRGLVRGGVSRI